MRTDQMHPMLAQGDEQRGPEMPRCPLCRSALVTIGFGLYPVAICTSCNARWIQDGHQQRAINQVQEPTLFASAR
jgi:hypothetical protein